LGHLTYTPTHTYTQTHQHLHLHTHTHTRGQGREFIIACQIFLINYALAKYSLREKYAIVFCHIPLHWAMAHTGDKKTFASLSSQSLALALSLLRAFLFGSHFLIRGNHKRFLSTTPGGATPITF